MKLIILIIVIVIILLSILLIVKNDNFTSSHNKKICCNKQGKNINCDNKNAIQKVCDTLKSPYFYCNKTFTNPVSEGGFGWDIPKTIENNYWKDYFINNKGFSSENAFLVSKTPSKYFKRLINNCSYNKKIKCYLAQSLLSMIPSNPLINSSNIHLFHSGILFVKDDGKKENIINPEDILCSLELWASGDSLIGCLLPTIDDNGIILDDKRFDIIMQAPQALGCSPKDYWKDHFNTHYYLGTTTSDILEKLYISSSKYNSDTYILTSLIKSKMCSSEKDYLSRNIISTSSSDYIHGFTCDRYCIEVIKYLCKHDPCNFNVNIFNNLNFNDFQIIYKNIEILDESDIINSKNLINEYTSKLSNSLINKTFTNQGDTHLINYDNVLNKLFRIFFPLFFHYIFKNSNTMYTIVTIDNQIRIAKVEVEYPFIQGVYGSCSGLLIK